MTARTIDVGEEKKKKVDGEALGKKFMDIVQFPFAFIAAVFKEAVRGNAKIVIMCPVFLCAIFANANTYWMMAGHKSVIPIPYFYDAPINPSQFWVVFLYPWWWVSVIFSLAMTVIQAPALRSEGHAEDLERKFQHYRSIKVPKDIDFDNHVTMTEVIAKQIKDIDVKELKGNTFLTLMGWTFEIVTTLSGFADMDLFSIKFLSSLCFAVILSALPELLMSQMLTILKERREALAREYLQKENV